MIRAQLLPSFVKATNPLSNGLISMEISDWTCFVIMEMELTTPSSLKKMVPTKILARSRTAFVVKAR